MIRIEFWNGQMSTRKKYEKYDGHVITIHNPCLWTNINEDSKPWRSVYPKALEFIKKYNDKEINSTELLHALRYVAYGYNNNGIDKRDYNNDDVVWPGNLTTKHKPKIIIKNGNNEFSINFYFNGNIENDKPTSNNWKCKIIEGGEFYWDL